MAAAPSDFGKFAHRILIGNFGDGTILAFNAFSGKFEGKLLSQSGNNIVVPGLWALSFGNGATAGSSTDLYFTAGPHDENDGLLASLPASAMNEGTAIERFARVLRQKALAIREGFCLFWGVLLC